MTNAIGQQINFKRRHAKRDRQRNMPNGVAPMNNSTTL